MIEKNIIIKLEDGLHMRPAMHIVDMAYGFKSNITITKNGIIADATSIMEVIMLGALKGEEITVTAEGKDEHKAMKAIKKLINSNFEDLIEAEK